MKPIETDETINSGFNHCKEIKFKPLNKTYKIYIFKLKILYEFTNKWIVKSVILL